MVRPLAWRALATLRNQQQAFFNNARDASGYSEKADVHSGKQLRKIAFRIASLIQAQGEISLSRAQLSKIQEKAIYPDGLGHQVLGSVTETVVRHSGDPVLVMRPGS
jgi:hypothetical protein